MVIFIPRFLYSSTSMLKRRMGLLKERKNGEFIYRCGFVLYRYLLSTLYTFIRNWDTIKYVLTTGVTGANNHPGRELE